MAERELLWVRTGGHPTELRTVASWLVTVAQALDAFAGWAISQSSTQLAWSTVDGTAAMAELRDEAYDAENYARELDSADYGAGMLAGAAVKVVGIKLGFAAGPVGWVALSVGVLVSLSVSGASGSVDHFTTESALDKIMLLDAR